MKQNGAKAQADKTTSRASVSNSQTAVNSDDDDSPCITCKKEFGAGDKSAQCDLCEGWECLACSSLDEATFDLMANNACAKLMFSCNGCQNSFPTLKKMNFKLTVLVKGQAATESRLAALETKCEGYDKNLDKKVDDIIKEKMDKVMLENDGRLQPAQKASDESAEQTVSSRITKEVHEALQEQKEREMRETNAIVFKMTESEEELGRDRQNHDISQIHGFCERLQVEAKVVRAHRLGVKARDSAETAPPRPLKVVFETSKQQKMFIREAAKLKQDEELEHIAVAPDLTPQQRAEKRKLRDNLRRRREAGEPNLLIRRGKIVQAKQNLRRGPDERKNVEAANPQDAEQQQVAPIAEREPPRTENFRDSGGSD